jgi:poly(3-hydroxybutyrate) depolymerase
MRPNPAGRPLPARCAPSRRARAAAAALVLAAAIAGCGERSQEAGQPAARLQAVPVAADSVTVSGMSAGGYMAVQFHVVHSALVHGAGVIAAGPYGCAENSLADALGRCMKGDGPIPTDELASRTSQLALVEEIDPIAGLADDRVWIFHGGADPVVAKPVVDALEAYYATLVAPSGIQRVELPGAGQTFPANGPGLADCGATESPFVGNCGIDGARLMLEHLYGPFARSSTATATGELRVINQAPYAAAMGAAGLADRGWLYVPAACSGKGAPGRCRLHVAFHGCKQGASYVQDTFVRRSGYLAAADAGDIVVLFPQAAPSFQPLNPNGCWDWWGYGSEAYDTRRGPQIMAIRAMVDDLLGANAAPVIAE